MTDFFKNDPPEDQDKEPEVEKIKIGEEEFDPEELKGLVDKGRFAKEVEDKYNTKLDKVWPEYTKTTQKLKEYEGELNELRKFKEEASRPQEEIDQERSVAEAREQARRLGLVVKEDLDAYVEAKLNATQQARDLLGQCDKLSGEINGDDGRPAFSTEAVLSHMKETGIRDPLKAYKDLNEAEIDKWKEANLLKAKKPGLPTETGSGGNHEPEAVKITKDNLMDAVREELYRGGE